MMKRIVLLMAALMLLCACCLTAQAEEAKCEILMAQGGSYTFLRDELGNVWGWGDNRHAQIGMEKLKLIGRPVLCATGLDGAQIVDIQCGNENSMFLMADGTVYACGANSKAQGGQGHANDVLRVPTKIDGLENIVAIASGYGHCLALDADGHVWAWGRNDKGQVGNGTQQAARRPVMLEGIDNVAQISCGGAFSMALTRDGKLYGWGSSEYGELGRVTTKYTLAPKEVTVEVPGLNIKQLDCGSCSVYLLADTGRIWCWGRNEFRQLGHEGSASPSVKPVEVALPDDVVVDRIIAYNSHTAAITDDGNLWIWGNTGAGQQGTGVFKTCFYPVLSHGEGQVVAAAVGSQMSGMVTKDGKVWITGYNKYGQLGCLYPGKGSVTYWVANGLNAHDGSLGESDKAR